MKKKNERVVGESHLLNKDTPFAIREAFNMLRTNLMYTMTENEEGGPVYGITSTIENTGKSTVITNLAVSFTHLHKKVLLVDGDMRCPTVHGFFGIDKRHAGLSELISGIQTDVVIKDVVPGLDLITSGRIPPNPSELITSPRFLDLLAEWRKQYDIVFIDFPPIGIVTDSLAICQHITGYIFAIRSGKSNAKAVNTAIESMERLGAKIVGVVLNDYNLKGVNGYRYNGSRYSAYSKSKYERAADDAEKDNTYRQ